MNKVKTASDYFNTLAVNAREPKLIKAIIDEDIKAVAKSEVGNLIILLINIFRIRYVNPTYIIPAIILQMPVGIFIITNILAMDCAIICVIIKINMATNDVLIAFFVLILFLLV